MTKANTEKRKEQIRNLFKTFGVYNAISTELLIKRLEAINFFVAPASTKYHGAYIGGLFDHSLEVANALVHLTIKLNLNWIRQIIVSKSNITINSHLQGMGINL